MDKLDIDEISNEIIKKELLRVVQTELGSDDVQFYCEHGSKKGC